MRFSNFGILFAVAAFTVSASAADIRVVEVEPTMTADDYATKELNSGDWSKAEAALLGAGVAKEDEVFTKLNLAFVYSSTGRTEQAVAIYQKILASKDNPYAMTVSGEPRRVKTIAKMALLRLEK